MERTVVLRRWGKRIAVLAATFAVAATFAANPGVRADEAKAENSGGVFHFDSSTRWPEWESTSETSLRFRVDAVVKFSRNEDEERSFKTSSVFFDDFAFDFIGDNGEIIIYSFSEKKFALIDPIRRLRTEVAA